MYNSLNQRNQLPSQLQSKIANQKLLDLLTQMGIVSIIILIAIIIK